MKHKTLKARAQRYAARTPSHIWGSDCPEQVAEHAYVAGYRAAKRSLRQRVKADVAAYDMGREEGAISERAKVETRIFSLEFALDQLRAAHTTLLQRVRDRQI